jgi:acyl carrier protein
MVSFNDFIDLVASELLVVDTSSISDTTNFRNLPNWSSLNALILISKVNENYGVFISSSDLASLNTLGDLHQLIAQIINGNK